MAEEGFLDPRTVHRIWDEHLNGTRNWQYLLWDVLMFEAWMERQGACHAPNAEMLHA